MRRRAVLLTTFSLLTIAVLLSTSCVCSALLSKVLEIAAPDDTPEPVAARPAPRPDGFGEPATDDMLPPLIAPPTRGTPPNPALREGKTGRLNVGTATALGSPSIPSSGDSFTLNKPGDALNGMTLTVPSGSYKDARTFKMSSAPITGCTFKDVTPATPLISIDNGGGYAADLMTVKIPIRLKPGQFAMGFIYDARAGKIEGLPLAGLDANSITIATRHFTDIFVSIFEEVVLSGDIDSGFRPDFDDWQFPNWGSYIEQSGHCAGQSLTAMWYYVTHPDGKDVFLYDRYDNNQEKPATPHLWFDDSRAYRLASVVQHDINWQTWENKLMEKLAGVDDELTWKAFAATMKATGEPQECGLYSKAGGGHDMICYRIKDRTLYIADPNYPADINRRIEWDSGARKFKPYNSGADAQAIARGEGKSYEIIQYAAKSATMEWDKIAARWTEMKAGTIGDGIFPAYTMTYLDNVSNTWREVTGDIIVTSSQLDVGPKSRDFGIVYRVYRDEKTLPFDRQTGAYTLLEGQNHLGVYTMAKVSQQVRRRDGTTATVTSTEYVDFRYIDVYYCPLSIAPKPLQGESGETYTFTATLKGSPAGVTWKWHIGGTPLADTTNVLKYAFSDGSTYEVTAAPYDRSGRKLGSVTTKATIKDVTSDRLAEIKRSRKVQAMITATLNNVTTSGGKTTESGPASVWWGQAGAAVEWSGNTFTYRKSDSTESTEMIGRVSNDGRTLVSLTWTWRLQRGDKTGSETWTKTLRIANMPIGKDREGTYGCVAEAGDIKQYVAEMKEEINQTDSSGGTSKTVTQSVTYGSRSALAIVFL